MPGFGLVEALLDAEEARRPKPHPAGLDQNAAPDLLLPAGEGGSAHVLLLDVPGY